MLGAFSLSGFAQDDDMYSFSSKKKSQSTTTTVQARPTTSYDESDANADYHTGQLRDVV